MTRIFMTLFVFLFATSAFAETKCGPYEGPNEVFVQATALQHPGLSSKQHTVLAGTYEAMMAAQTVFKDDSVSQANRDLAKRTMQALGEMAAFQALSYERMPEFNAVLAKMRTEESSGLTRVSNELLPEVRKTASSMVALGQIGADISLDITYISADRFIAVAKSGKVIPTVVDALNASMCTLEASSKMLHGVAKMLPSALALATVKNLNY